MNFANMDEVAHSQGIFTTMSSNYGTNFVDVIINNVKNSIMLNIEKLFKESDLAGYVDCIPSPRHNNGSVGRVNTVIPKQELCNFTIKDKFKQYNQDTEIGSINIEYKVLSSYAIKYKLTLVIDKFDSETFECKITMRYLNRSLQDNGGGITNFKHYPVQTNDFINATLNEIRNFLDTRYKGE
ncbi:hypothetical protein D1872_37350 [compost metagenome]